MPDRPLHDLSRCAHDAARSARSDACDLVRACVETVFYRKTILDPPPGWPKFRVLLPVRKARRP